MNKESNKLAWYHGPHGLHPYNYPGAIVVPTHCSPCISYMSFCDIDQKTNRY